MKKALFSSLAIGLLMSATAWAGGGIVYPTVQGNDVLIPDILIKAIPGFDPSKPVYAATDINGWLSRDGEKGGKWGDKERLEMTRINMEDGVWVAKGLKGQRFHPAQKTDKGVAWAKIEEVYDLNAPYVDMSKGTPCLKVKE